MTLTRRSLLATAVASPIIALTATRSIAATAPIYSEDRIAIDGTDPLSYFTVGEPVAGSADITHGWMGATWRFTSEENRAAFAANPEAFAPQYGGYCAWAVAQDDGYIATTIPEAWKIVDGKLYLNFSRRIQRRWEKDIPGFIASGDTNWPKLLLA